MKRGMLGSVSVDTENYWTEGKNSQELRCNETVIYAEIDDRQSDALIAKTQEDVQKAYNEMDMFWLILQAIKLYALDATLLRRAGVVIGNFINEGKFSLSFDNVQDENIYVVNLLGELTTRTENFNENGENENFMAYYVENVIELNYYNNTDGTKTVDRPHLDGLAGNSTSDEWSMKMKEAGTYLLYNVSNTNIEGLDQKAVARKKAEQGKLLAWLHNSSNNMTKNSILANARSGIKEKLGMQPDEALKTMGQQAKQGTKGVGELVAIIAVIVICIALILKVVEAVMAAKYQNSINKAYKDALNDDAPNQSSLEGASPNYGDWLKTFLEDDEEEEEFSLMMKDENGEELPIWKQPVLWIAGVLVLGVTGIGIASAMKKKKAKQ